MLINLRHKVSNGYLSSIVVPVVVVLVVEVPLKVRLLTKSHPSPVHGMRRKPAAEEHVEYFLGRHICNGDIDSQFDLHY